MEIMQMHYGGIQRSHVVNQLACSTMRHESLVIEESCTHQVNCLVNLISNMIELRLAGILPSAIGNMTLPPLCHGLLPYKLRYPAMRSPVGSNIDLQ